MNNKYVFECWFNGKPECNKCMLSRSKGIGLDGETVVGCAGLGSMPKCAEEGCRKDCPLKPVE